MITGSKSLKARGFLLVFSLAATLGHAVVPPVDIEKDPYVQLYQNRVEQVRLDVEQATLDYDVEKWYLDSLEALVPTHGAHPQEVEQFRHTVTLAKLKIEKAEQVVKERMALVETVKALRKAGKEAPLYISEK